MGEKKGLIPPELKILHPGGSLLLGGRNFFLKNFAAAVQGDLVKSQKLKDCPCPSYTNQAY
jgi:hypothetical protein